MGQPRESLYSPGPSNITAYTYQAMSEKKIARKSKRKILINGQEVEAQVNPNNTVNLVNTKTGEIRTVGLTTTTSKQPTVERPQPQPSQQPEEPKPIFTLARAMEINKQQIDLSKANDVKFYRSGGKIVGVESPYTGSTAVEYLPGYKPGFELTEESALQFRKDVAANRMAEERLATPPKTSAERRQEAAGLGIVIPQTQREKELAHFEAAKGNVIKAGGVAYSFYGQTSGKALGELNLALSKPASDVLLNTAIYKSAKATQTKIKSGEIKLSSSPLIAGKQRMGNAFIVGAYEEIAKNPASFGLDLAAAGGTKLAFRALSTEPGGNFLYNLGTKSIGIGGTALYAGSVISAAKKNDTALGASAVHLAVFTAGLTSKAPTEYPKVKSITEGKLIGEGNEFGGGSQSDLIFTTKKGKYYGEVGQLFETNALTKNIDVGAVGRVMYPKPKVLGIGGGYKGGEPTVILGEYSQPPAYAKNTYLFEGSKVELGEVSPLIKSQVSILPTMEEAVISNKKTSIDYYRRITPYVRTTELIGTKGQIADYGLIFTSGRMSDNQFFNERFATFGKGKGGYKNQWVNFGEENIIRPSTSTGKTISESWGTKEQPIINSGSGGQILRFEAKPEGKKNPLKNWGVEPQGAEAEVSFGTTTRSLGSVIPKDLISSMQTGIMEFERPRYTTGYSLSTGRKSLGSNRNQILKPETVTKSESRYNQRLGLVPELKLEQRPEQKQVTTSKLITEPKLTQTPRLGLVNRTRLDFAPRFGLKLAQELVTPTIQITKTNQTNMPPSLVTILPSETRPLGFKLPSIKGESFKKGKKSGGFKFNTKYSPSLEASLFNIKGTPTRLGTISGLGLRPILR